MRQLTALQEDILARMREPGATAARVADAMGRERRATERIVAGLRHRGLLPPAADRGARIQAVADMFRAGMSYAEIGAAIGRSRHCASSIVCAARAKGLLDGVPMRLERAPGLRVPDGPRCACGLLAPCAGHESLGHRALARMEWV